MTLKKFDDRISFRCMEVDHTKFLAKCRKNKAESPIVLRSLMAAYTKGDIIITGPTVRSNS